MRSDHSQPDEKSELTVRDAANLLSVSPDTVRRYIREGRLPARNISPQPTGRPQYRVRRSEVLQLRDNYRQQGWSPPAQPRRATARPQAHERLQWIDLE